MEEQCKALKATNPAIACVVYLNTAGAHSGYDSMRIAMFDRRHHGWWIANTDGSILNKSNSDFSW